MLKKDDKVKVLDGEELNASHRGAIGTVKAIHGSTVSVVFDGVDGEHTYQEDQLVVQKK